VATVLIVDDHQLLATALAVTLRRTGVDADTAAPAPFPELLATLNDAAPQIVLLDLDLGAYGDSTPLIAPLTRAGIRVVVVTGLDDRVRIAAALEQGAIGYRSKADGLDALVATVLAAHTGDEPLDAPTRVRLLEELRRARADRAEAFAPFTTLTEREQETLRCIARGRSVREIADDWVVSEATVRTHVRSVLAKLEVRSQLGAVALAIRTGWLELPASRLG
jgi:DNA-binding NarL/FixJ family response regulator